MNKRNVLIILGMLVIMFSIGIFVGQSETIGSSELAEPPIVHIYNDIYAMQLNDTLVTFKLLDVEEILKQ